MRDAPPISPTLFQVTDWALVRQAQSHPDALQDVIAAYYPALRSYCLHLCRRFDLPEDQADDFLHEFVIHTRCLAVPVGRADPARGRFRNLLRTSLFHMVIDHLRSKKHPVPLTADPPGPGGDGADPEDEAFDTGWAELAARSAVEELFRWAGEKPERARVWNVFKARYLLPDPWTGPRITEVFGREAVGNVDSTARTARGKFQEFVLHHLSRQAASPQDHDDAVRDFFDVIYRHDRLGEWRATDLPFLAPAREEHHSALMGVPAAAAGLRLRGLVHDAAAELVLNRWLAEPVSPGPNASSLGEVLGGRVCSLEELQHAKAFAKHRRYASGQQTADSAALTDAAFTTEVATWVYYAAIALALHHHRTVISRSDAASLRSGLFWAAEQTWGLPDVRPILEAVASDPNPLTTPTGPPGFPNGQLHRVSPAGVD